MDPYRPLHCVPAEDEEGDGDRDDRILGALLAFFGLARVIPALALGEGFGGEATLASLMVVVGALMVFELPRRLRARRRRSCRNLDSTLPRS